MRERNAEDNCVAEVAATAIENAVSEAWDKHGLLHDFELTREDGVPLVRAAKHAAPR